MRNVTAGSVEYFVFLSGSVQSWHIIKEDIDMARVKLNPILEQIRGQVGELVFRRYGDKVVIGRKPDLSDVEPSEAQLAHRQRFTQAALYGKMVLTDPDTKALYEETAAKKGQPLFSLMVADFFNAPSVDEIDLSAYQGAPGDEVVILASDDFNVLEVQVNVTDADGNPIESGAAAETPAESGRWIYTASASVDAGTTVKFLVTASDRPGGSGQAEETVEL